MGEGLVFAHQLLHPVLTEHPGSGGMGRDHGLDGFGLADRHHGHVVRDSLAHRGPSGFNLLHGGKGYSAGPKSKRASPLRNFGAIQVLFGGM